MRAGMMTSRRVILRVVFPALFLSACNPPPPPIAYIRNSAKLHTITVVTPAISDQPYLLQGEMNSIADSPVLGGAIAALVVGGIEMHRQDMVDTAVQAQGFSPQSELNTDIVNALRAKGYTVTLMTLQRKDAKFLDYYPLVSTDAYLDVVVPVYGYGQQGFAPYKPMLQAQYRLTTVKAANIVMQGSLASYSDPAGSSSYQLTNVSTMNKNAKDAVAGLRSELAEVAAASTNEIP